MTIESDSSSAWRRSPSVWPTASPCGGNSSGRLPAPRQSVIRPFEMWSSVAVALATTPGLRNGLPTVRWPSLTCFVVAAQAAERRVRLEERLVEVALRREQVVVHQQEVEAEPVDLLAERRASGHVAP